MIAKKTLLMSISVALLIQFGVQANDTPPELEFQDVVPTRVPVELDGNITDEEWGHATAIHNPEFYIPKGDGDFGDLVLFEEHGGGVWEGEDDHSTTTKFLFDSENLYISHLVVDDFHEHASGTFYVGDSAQIMIADEFREFQVALYNFALIGVEDDRDFVPECGPDADLCILNEEAGPGGTDVAIVRGDGVTSYEIMLTAESLDLGVPLEPGMVLGFGVAINDGDEFEPGQAGWGGLGAHSIVFGKTPEETVELTLVEAAAVEDALQAGDADQNLEFNQLDLVAVQIAAKYLTGQAATWGEGDWDGAPGGSQGNPPPGNGLFDQIDIIAALNAGKYLTGKYAAIPPDGQIGDAQTSIVYDANTGDVGVDAPAGTDVTSVNIDSASGIFVNHANAQNLDGSFDTHSDTNIFKATFGSSFGSLSFGMVATTGLDEDFVANDLTVIGSLDGGGGLGDVDLVYIPEPSTIVLFAIGLFLCLGMRKR